MIIIPKTLLLRQDLSILERALIPLIATHTQQWGGAGEGISVSVLADTLRMSPREIAEGCDSLVKKKILKTTRKKTPEGMMITYSFVPLPQEHDEPVQSNTPYTDSTYYLNISDDLYEDLQQFALELCDKEGLRRDLFEEFNLYQRSKNNRSFDWFAEFERWIRRELSTSKNLSATPAQIEDSKPTTEQFELARYLIHRLSSIDPQFEEPFDVMSWARQMHYIIETGYSVLDVKNVIDWLFSAKGDWFRPNVPDAYHLRKHFKRLIGYTRSFRDGAPKLPDGMNIFDIIGRN